MKKVNIMNLRHNIKCEDSVELNLISGKNSRVSRGYTEHR